MRHGSMRHGSMRVWAYLWNCIAKDMMGGLRDTLVKELQVIPLFNDPSLVVTTTTTHSTYIHVHAHTMRLRHTCIIYIIYVHV